MKTGIHPVQDIGQLKPCIHIAANLPQSSLLEVRIRTLQCSCGRYLPCPTPTCHEDLRQAPCGGAVSRQGQAELAVFHLVQHCLEGLMAASQAWVGAPHINVCS